jgi:hypothetical protein
MPDYTAIAVKCKAGLTKAGMAVTLRRTTPGTYSPATGTYSGDVVTDYAAVGLIQSRSLYQTGSVGQNYFNEVLVQTDDVFIILAASGLVVTPAPGDLLIVSGVSFTVITMIPLRPGGINLMYRVLARR